MVSYDSKYYIFGHESGGDNKWSEHRYYVYEESDYEDYTIQISDSPSYDGILKYQDESGFVQKSDGIYNRLSGGSKVSDITTYSKWLYDGTNHYIVLSDGTSYRYDGSLGDSSRKQIDVGDFSKVNSIYRRGSVILMGLDSTTGLFRQTFESHVKVSYDDYREVSYGIDVEKIVDGNDDTGTILAVYKSGDDNVSVLKYRRSSSDTEDFRFYMTVGGVRSEIELQDIFYLGNRSDENYAIKRDGGIYQAINKSKTRFNRVEYFDGLVRMDDFGGYSYALLQDKVIRYSNSDKGFQFVHASDGSTYRYFKIRKYDDEKYVMSSSHGLYYFILTDTGKIYKAQSSDSSHIVSLTGYKLKNDVQRYMFARGRSVYTSTDFKKDAKYFDLPDDLVVNDIDVIDTYTHLFSTSNGFYRTSSKYQLVNDIKKFTTDDARVLYENMSDEIDDYADGAMDKHVEEFHKEDSVMTYVNENCLDATLSNLVGWTGTSVSDGYSDITSTKDLVKEIVFGDQSDGDVQVTINNNQTNFKDETVSVSYIAKKYNSGITELDIYIPTTKTYYLCHTQGSANCSGNMFDKVYRKNLDQINGIQTTVDASLENNTKITLGVDNVLFGIDDVLDVTITGNSLPLKIYKDDTYEAAEGTAA